jgi:predicted lipoprotein with Yx(FWY)xxD motif
MKRIALPVMFALACLAGGAQAAEPAKTASTDKGAVFVDGKGRALYTYDEDMTGMSMCNGKCLENWPAFIAEPGATPEGDWTLVKRDDGQQQWAYKDKPLYTWKNDAKPGDVTGDGKGGVWHVAKP